ncbi:hypothetical protein GGP66_002875 [Salinibacter ruber]|nr:hypothetical protein [Salinibacter ruber]
MHAVIPSAINSFPTSQIFAYMAPYIALLS